MRLTLVAVQVLNRLPTFLTVYLAVRLTSGSDESTVAALSLIFASFAGWIASSVGVAILRRQADGADAILAPRDLAGFSIAALALFPAVSATFLLATRPTAALPWATISLFSVAFLFAILSQSLTLTLIRLGKHRKCLIAAGLSAATMTLGIALPVQAPAEIACLLCAAAAMNFFASIHLSEKPFVRRKTSALRFNDFSKLLASNFLSVWTNTTCVFLSSKLLSEGGGLAFVVASFQWQQAITMLPQSSAMSIMTAQSIPSGNRSISTRQARHVQTAKLAITTTGVSVACFFFVPTLYGSFQLEQRTALAFILSASLPYTVMVINGAYLVVERHDNSNFLLNLLWSISYIAATIVLIQLTADSLSLAIAYALAYFIAAAASEVLIRNKIR